VEKEASSVREDEFRDDDLGADRTNVLALRYINVTTDTINRTVKVPAHPFWPQNEVKMGVF
jgi:hypothetical protein